MLDNSCRVSQENYVYKYIYNHQKHLPTSSNRTQSNSRRIVQKRLSAIPAGVHCVVIHRGEHMKQPLRAMKKIRTVRNLRDEVYKILYHSITTGVFTPGTQLKEVDLVDELDVSRTPIREALNQLSKEGLVEIIPRKGAFVRRWTKEEALEILFLREALESLAGRLATSRMTDEEIDALETLMVEYEKGRLKYVEADKKFHEGIVNTCGLERLKELIGNLYDRFQMSNVLALSFSDRERVKASIKEHRRIIKALRARDESQVEQAMKDNFRKTRAIVEGM